MRYFTLKTLSTKVGVNGSGFRCAGLAARMILPDSGSFRIFEGTRGPVPARFLCHCGFIITVSFGREGSVFFVLVNLVFVVLQCLMAFASRQ